MQTIIFASTLLLLLLAAHQSDAIKCFECNSYKDANCALDLPPENLLKDCQEDYSTRGKGFPTYCRKIKQVIEFPVNNLPPDSRIIRSCGFQNQSTVNSCYQRAGFGARQIVCSCDTDNCNGATALRTDLWAIGAIILAATFILTKIGLN